jgi:uncharacterized protein YbjT (DUF2867 family)
MAKIFVTGSTGFIGQRIVSRLLEEGHEIFALSRSKESKNPSPQYHLVYGDLKEVEKIEIPTDIDAAYYLVHSMGSLVQNLVEQEEAIARNFLRLIEKTKCRQIIYLGGIIEDEKELSSHLRSRLAIEKVLKASPIPCTILRASIIIGEGSASFQIIRDLVEKLPVMIAPRWVRSYCQPIAIEDVLFYLSKVLLNPACFGNTYDIGGPEELSFKELLLRYAALRKFKRYILDIPLLTPRLSSYWLLFISSVPLPICIYLVESMRHNTRKLNRAIDEILPHQCLPFEAALR